MEILQEIIIHFSFDMIRTFSPFSSHTFSVDAQTNRRLKLPKHMRDVAFSSDESLLLFLIAREVL